jgi:PAS domain S-box-containing protein
MKTPLGYRIIENIEQKGTLNILRSMKKADRKQVILKVASGKYTTSKGRAFLRHEYNLLMDMVVPGVIQPLSLEDHHDQMVAVYEDPGGSPLRKMIKSGFHLAGGLSLGDFLYVALSMTANVQQIHGKHIIHKNLNPDNFFLNPESLKSHLTGFYIASKLPREESQPLTEALEDSLPYTSPEQTGRMNRTVDLRSDLYSLGATLYELATGGPPFSVTDPVELVHFILAKRPLPPYETNPGLPLVISNMIIKLMAKEVEQRYQSASGLTADLEECLSRLAATGWIDDFTIGRLDFPHQLKIPEKLYGRNRELNLLSKSFEKACKGRKELILLSGDAGIGKTSVVNEIYSLTPHKMGFLLYGKFNRVTRNIPYSALVDAFRALVRQLLRDSPENLMLWKEKLSTALGTNGQIIIDVIPEMELIIGSQTSIEELEPIEAQNRFTYTFIRFIRIFGQAEHPLVVFLDDLQWADSATFKLIRAIMADEEAKYLLLIGAYRQNEVAQFHPLNDTLEALQSEGTCIEKIVLGPLDLIDIAQLIADTLKLKKSQVSFLTRTVLEKTNGNPFFITCFLNTIFQEDLLKFESDKRRWKWDLKKIKELSVTENVVDLLIRTVNRLPAATLNAIKVGACIGNRFDLITLNTIMEKGVNRLLQDLLPAVENGLLISSFDYHIIDEEKDAYEIATFKFLHDRIQQAVFEMIDHDWRKEIHLQLGRNKIRYTDPKKLEDEIFEIVRHLNISAELIQNQDERCQVAEFNLIASRQAKQSAAFEHAFQYAKAGLALLRHDAWKTHYDLTLSLYTEALQTAYLNVDLDEIEILFGHVIKNSRNFLDQVSAYKSRIQAYLAQNRLMEAINTGFEILKLLGIDFPEHPDMKDIQAAYEESRSLLKKKTIEDLVQMPKMTDPIKKATLKLLSDICVPIYFSRPSFLPLMIFKAVALSVFHGNLPESSFIYSVYGLILSGLYADIDTGYQFGKLGMKLAEKKDYKEFRCKNIEIFNVHIRHNKEHIRETLDPLLAGYQIGMETGDFQFANFCVFNRCSHAYLLGQDLAFVEKEMNRFSQAINQNRQVTVLHFHSIFQQAVLNLRGTKGDPHILVGDVYDERIMLARHQQAKDRHALNYFYLNKMILGYLFEEYELALAYSQQAESYLDGAIAMFVVPVFHFYDSLIQLASYTNSSEGEKEKILRKVTRNQEKMKTWSNHAPMNHLHKYLLVEAERLRILGRDMEAFDHYDLAITNANKSGYSNEEALSFELTARFWQSKGKDNLAGLYMHNAWCGYTQWGALLKVRHLENRYSNLLKSTDVVINDAAKKEIIFTDVAAQSRLDGIDLVTVIKASQAVSSEILIDELINIFMKVLMEDVGAQKGVLIFRLGDSWAVEAYSFLDQKIVLSRPGLPVEDFKDLSMKIVEYVARTGENVVLYDASREGQFTEDPYIRTNSPRSILCVPIIHKTELNGIIYLENNLSAGVFTTERLEVIKILATQIAISVENARLYSNLKVAEEQYRSIFENAVEGIYQTTPDGKFLSVNPATARILGYDSPKELLETVNDIGKQLYVVQGDRNKFLELIQKKQAVSGLEIQFRRKDGSVIWVSLHARTVHEENGDIKLIEGFFVNITERKQSVEALREREEYLRKENIRLRSNIKDRYKFANIIGKSAAMQEVYELILKAAATDVPVIIYGKSGTGKELAARAIHEMSDRKCARFLPVNCGAIPENLLESEFFGYKKGAFTGANDDKDGFLDLADKGTLFLDELGEIGLNLQVKLLRALEGGGFTPLGGRELRKPDFRIIAATNLDLKNQIRKGLMREDFYYRVNIFPIRMPPLRERSEDIPLLIEYFWKVNGYEKTQPHLPAHVISHMLDYEWPGNVRELQNTLHRYVALNRLDFLGAAESVKSQAELVEPNMASVGRPLNDVVAEFEKRYIARLLEKHQWHRTRVAFILGIGRKTLYRKMISYGLMPPENGS